jgi:polyhydroxyalkanoate synthesis regulator phasin
MAGLGDIVQKAFYLGVGVASYAAERLQELRGQAQKLADEMVARGEMTAAEARKFVDDIVEQAQQQQPIKETEKPEARHKEPRRIEIVADDEESQQPEQVDELRDRVQSLQDELRKLRRDS